MKGKRWMLVLVGILALTMAQASLGAEKVKFASSWVLSGPDAGYYAARERGFYRKAGFEVDIVRGFGSGNTIKYVSAGTVNFGFADMASLVGGRAKGAKAKELATVYGKAPHGIYFLKGSGIRKPKDLEGRTIGAAQGSATYRTFGAFVNLAGLDRSKVKFQFMDSPSILPSVLTGKVDAGLFYVTESPGITLKAMKIKKSVGAMFYRDSGFNIYANGIIVHEDDIKKDPDRVRRFLKATIQGLAYGVDNPKEAVNDFLRFNPNVSKVVSLGQWKVVVGLLSTQEAKKNGIGYMLRSKVKNTRDLMTKLLKLETKINVDDLYTNQFNPKIFPKSW